MDLTAKQQASGEFDPARAGLSRPTAGTGTLPAGAWLKNQAALMNTEQEGASSDAGQPRL